MHANLCLGILLVGLLAGFGVGRIKNSAKLAKIRGEVEAAKNFAFDSASNLAKAIEKHL